MGEQTDPAGSFSLSLRSRGGKDSLTASSTAVHLEWIPEVVKCTQKRGHPGSGDLVLTASQDQVHEPASLP